MSALYDVVSALLYSAISAVDDVGSSKEVSFTMNDIFVRQAVPLGASAEEMDDVVLLFLHGAAVCSLCTLFEEKCAVHMPCSYYCHLQVVSCKTRIVLVVFFFHV